MAVGRAAIVGVPEGFLCVSRRRGSVGLVEFLEDGQADRVVIVDAPFVLGAVSASIAANLGTDLRGVVAAALEARTANGPGGVRSIDELA